MSDDKNEVRKIALDELEDTGVGDWFAPGNGGCGAVNCGCCNKNN